MEEKQKKRFCLKDLKYEIIAVVVLTVAIGTVWFAARAAKKEEPNIINESLLEKIINVSDLSTFEAVYNGIARVMNKQNPDKVDYYVSYKAKVKAGVDFEKVAITVDNEEKLIRVNLPEIKVNDVNVDIASLDYIFENERANTSTVSEEAYKKCIEDVTNESKEEQAIYELAKQNAKNIVEALISPFVEQLDADYRLEIN